MTKFITCTALLLLTALLLSCCAPYIKIYNGVTKTPQNTQTEASAETQKNTEAPKTTEEQTPSLPTVKPSTEPFTLSTLSPTETVSETPTEEPTEEPTAEPTLSPITESLTQTTEEGQILTLISLSSPVGRNQKATVSIMGKPNTEYTIEVYYSTAASTAKGLEAKLTNEDGLASWTWKVGASTAEGSHRITIKGGGEILETEFYTTV